MSKHMYRRAFDEIKPSPQLIQDTTANALKPQLSMKKSKYQRYAIASSLLVVVLLVGMVSLQINHNGTWGNQVDNIASQLPDNQGLTPNSALNKPILPQGLNNYVPFHANEYVMSKAPAPKQPLTYSELIQQSQIIVLGTIDDIGVYRHKDEQYNPKASFGTYIYTLKVDKVLSGNLEEGVDRVIPIAERAWAKPKDESEQKDIKEWSFSPYTGRPNEAAILEKGKQYVMLLSGTDASGVYAVPFDGYGIFPVDYIEQESSNHSLVELQGLLQNADDTPLKADLLYKIYSLYIKEEYL